MITNIELVNKEELIVIPRFFSFGKNQVITFYDFNGNVKAEISDFNDNIVSAMRSSRDGKKLLVGFFVNVAVEYDVATQKPLRKFKYPDKEKDIKPFWICHSPDEQEVWVSFHGDGKGNVYRYDNSDDCIGEYKGCYWGISPDHTRSATLVPKKGKLNIEEIKTGKKVGETVEVKFPLMDLVLSSNNKVAMWDILGHDGNLIISNEKGEQVSSCNAGNQPFVKCPQFSPSGEDVVAGTENALNFFNSNSGKLINTRHINGCPMLAQWKEEALVVVSSPYKKNANNIVYILKPQKK